MMDMLLFGLSISALIINAVFLIRGWLWMRRWQVLTLVQQQIVVHSWLATNQQRLAVWTHVHGPLSIKIEPAMRAADTDD